MQPFKYQNLIKAKKDSAELIALGYKIVKMNGDIHWRIFKEDYETVVDVWPTKRKMYKLKSYGRAEVYNNIVEVTKYFEEEI